MCFFALELALIAKLYCQEVQQPRFVFRSADSLYFSGKLVVTLGPAGTSSEFAAKHLTDQVCLFHTYEAAEQFAMECEECAAFVVANAYQDINRFYISKNSRPVGAFFLDTPSYVLAAKEALVVNYATRVASHRAPAHLVPSLLPKLMTTVIEVSSTSEAARMTADGEVEACLTTKLACEYYGLIPLFDTGCIPMLWTIFETRKSAK